jgi:hypothetical protein
MALAARNRGALGFDCTIQYWGFAPVPLLDCNLTQFSGK